jgi:hypothetical protein
MSITHTFKVGDRILFGRPGAHQTPGEVVKVNPKRLKVRALEARRRYPAGTIWGVSPGICFHAGIGQRPPEPVKPRRTEAEILAQIRKSYSALSPENLSGDGEYPAWVVKRRRNQATRELHECFRELGRTVSEQESFQTQAPYWPSAHPALADLMRQFD